jgi:carbon-monoxide dehydrogenase large subunit
LKSFSRKIGWRKGVRSADLPDIAVEHIETPWPHTSLGAKGAEAGTTGSVGAVLNAVNDAIRPLGVIGV